MNHLRTLRTTAVGLTLTMLLVACGQKPGVHVESGRSGPLGSGSFDDGDQTDGTGDGFDSGGDVGTDDGGFDVGGDAGGGASGSDGAFDDAGGGDAADGDASGDGGAPGGGGTAGGGSGGGSTSGGSTSGGSASGGSGAGDDGATSGSSGGRRQVTGSDRTGVGDDTITLAVHAPVTGAAPLPSTSFEKARDTYWRHLADKGETVLGRSKVEVLFKDDKYDPNSARQVCRELASKAFFTVGGGGTDQIQACGQFAAVAKTPYFSAGVTEEGLSGNPWYFATSMTYRQQGVLLASYVTKNFGGKKVAAVVTDTPNFDDAVAGWDAGRQSAGMQNYYKTLRHPKGDTSWYSSFAQELKSAGVQVVYINSSPVDYIRFAQKSREQGFNPQWVGVGITMGLNAVLQSGCDFVDGGIFFSPFPGLDKVDQLDPDFNKASAKFGTPNDDLALALWGLARQQHELFKRYGSTYGQDLTREDFRALTEAQGSLKTSIFPEVGYSQQNHFGGKQVHVLQADCSTKRHKTLATFASSF